MAVKNIHAGCVLLGKAGQAFGAAEDAGVLILGGSGSGKSDLMLRLIAAGSVLVADDRTDLTVEGNLLIASPPAALAGLMEIRGLGIVTLAHRGRTIVKLVADLTPGQPQERMPAGLRYCPPDGLSLPEAARPPLIRLDPLENSAPAKIAAAVAALSRSR